MIIQSSLKSFGNYCIFISRVFTFPDRWKEFFRRYVNEILKLGIDSIPLVIVISIFIGAVCTIQMYLNTTSPLMPRYAVGLATREIILLEFSSSILCLILAGKVGSNIASEIGTMRVTEQIDALEIMGVNSANFLVLPKVMAMVTFINVLVVFSMFTSLWGGYMVCAVTGLVPVSTYIYGIQTQLVCVVCAHQVAVRCLRGEQRGELLWLLCERRCTRCGQGKYKLCGHEQHHHSSARCDSYQLDAAIE